MSLFNSIKIKNIEALKTGDKLTRSVYTLLIGEVTRGGDPKDTISDAMVISAAKKIVDGIEMMLENGAEPDVILAERKVLLALIPEAAAEDDIRKFVDEFVSTANPKLTMKDMGVVMAAIKTHFNGRADGKLSSSFARCRLASNE